MHRGSSTSVICSEAAGADNALMDGDRSSNSRDGSRSRQKCGHGTRHVAIDLEKNGSKNIAADHKKMSVSLGV